MHEIIVNLHMHTRFSDGSLTHAEIAQAALKAGIDVAIVTDHNVYVQGPEDWYTEGDRRVLLLVGEEIHDQARQPQKNHLLVFGAGVELAPLAWDTRRLLDSIRQAGGLAFIAHPVDPEAPAFNEANLSWEDWSIQGYHGLEVWNAMSEFKSRLKSRLHAIYYVFNPSCIAEGPFPEALQRWDQLLESGLRVTGIGGTDAHALKKRIGPIQRVLFPFEFHFKTVNTHLILNEPLSGDLEADRNAILGAMRQGCGFIGYDLPAPTRGFRFTAQGYDKSAQIGEEIPAANGVTLQIRLPAAADCDLIRYGKIVQSWQGQQHCSYITSQPGAYRVEVHLPYKGRRCGWIYSNPIYVKIK